MDKKTAIRTLNWKLEKKINLVYNPSVAPVLKRASLADNVSDAFYFYGSVMSRV
jgi:hypothetical protein